MLPFAHHTQFQRQGCCHSHITHSRTSHTVAATMMLPFAHHTQSQRQGCCRSHITRMSQVCCHSHITHSLSDSDITIRTSHTVAGTGTAMLPFAHLVSIRTFAHHTQSQRQGCCHSHITRMSQVCCHSHLFHVPCLGPLPCVILVDGELKAMLQ